MELYMFRYAEWERRYNCAGVDIDSIPFEQRAGQFRPRSWALVVLCSIYYPLYVPCLLSIWKKHKGGNSCYTILLYIGCMNVAILWMIGYLHAILSLEGFVFCSSPVALYMLGTFCLALWIAESTADMILALNRCLVMVSPKCAAFLFAGWRVWIWLGLCSAYAFYFLLFTPSAIFSAITWEWYFYPFTGFREDMQEQFDNNLHDYHNVCMAIFFPIIYAIFAIKFGMKFKGNFQGIGHVQKMIFLQVFLISTLNFMSALGYLLGSRFVDKHWIIILSHFGWLNIHGFPPIMLLCLNQTIRKDCLMMAYKVFCSKKVGHLHGVTIIRPAAALVTDGPHSTATGGNEWRSCFYSYDMPN